MLGVLHMPLRCFFIVFTPIRSCVDALAYKEEALTIIAYVKNLKQSHEMIANILDVAIISFF